MSIIERKWTRSMSRDGLKDYDSTTHLDHIHVVMQLQLCVIWDTRDGFHIRYVGLKRWLLSGPCYPYEGLGV